MYSYRYTNSSLYNVTTCFWRLFWLLILTSVVLKINTTVDWRINGAFSLNVWVVCKTTIWHLNAVSCLFMCNNVPTVHAQWHECIFYKLCLEIELLFTRRACMDINSIVINIDTHVAALNTNLKMSCTDIELLWARVMHYHNITTGRSIHLLYHKLYTK